MGQEKNPNRVQGGRNAQAYGGLFETIFKKMCTLQGVGVTSIPSGCKILGRNKIIPVKSPFDWIISYQSRTGLIDTKTVDGFVYPASLIKEHQVRELLQHERKGTIAGYVIWLRKAHKVFFMPARILEEYRIKGGSFDHNHVAAVDLGGESLEVKRIFHAVHPLFWPAGVI